VRVNALVTDKEQRVVTRRSPDFFVFPFWWKWLFFYSSGHLKPCASPRVFSSEVEGARC
jgi:hypothetical protein